MIFEMSTADMFASLVEAVCAPFPIKYVPRSAELMPMTEKEAVESVVKCFRSWKLCRQQAQIQEIMKRNKAKLELVAHLRQAQDSPKHAGVYEKEDENALRHLFNCGLDRHFQNPKSAEPSADLREKAVECLFDIAACGNLEEKLLKSVGFCVFEKLWHFQRPIQYVLLSNPDLEANDVVLECKS